MVWWDALLESLADSNDGTQVKESGGMPYLVCTSLNLVFSKVRSFVFRKPDGNRGLSMSRAYVEEASIITRNIDLLFSRVRYDKPDCSFLTNAYRLLGVCVWANTIQVSFYRRRL